jgi:hypothetical protein
MHTSQTGCSKRPPRRSAWQGLLGWYRAWVQMREARYRYLEAILDGTPDPGARSDEQRNREKQDGAS